MGEIQKDKGVSLMEILVCITVLMMVAAAIVPNVMNLIERTRQKRTMSDMMIWKAALGTYFVDYSFYPFDPTGPDAQINPGVFLYSMFIKDKYLEKPVYLDGWNNPLCYTGGYDMITAWGYTIASLGKGGIAELGGPSRFKCFQCDIRLSNGEFFSQPEGYQVDNSTAGCLAAAPCL